VRLEDIALHLRRRSPWEALDLGQAMLLAWSRQVYGAWFATYWLAGIVILLLLWPWPELAMFVLWWLKPLFDRVLLLVFSRSVFGAAPSVREVLREVPRLCRGPGVLSGLSLRRFSLARSFLLPVWQLEEQHGADARARFRLLSRRYRGYAVWLTFFGANMSTVLLFASLATLLALAPADSHHLSLWDWFFYYPSRTRGLVPHLAFMLADTVVESALHCLGILALPELSYTVTSLGNRVRIKPSRLTSGCISPYLLYCLVVLAFALVYYTYYPFATYYFSILISLTASIISSLIYYNSSFFMPFLTFLYLLPIPFFPIKLFFFIFFIFSFLFLYIFHLF